MGLALITVGTLFNRGVEEHPELGYPAIFALLIFIIGFAMSAGPIIWVLCSEIYPLSGRDLGVTFSTATNWIANAIVGQTFLMLLAGFGLTGISMVSLTALGIAVSVGAKRSRQAIARTYGWAAIYLLLSSCSWLLHLPAAGWTGPSAAGSCIVP